MTVDEVLADPAAALELDAGCVPLHVIVICEYARPDADEHPDRNGLAVTTDDQLAPWGGTSIGMLRFAAQLEYDAVADNMDAGEDSDA